ncbi:zinc finger protein Xfin-like [Stegodyphus dumicola]|uniref:zinc finger protein Xfin-like n=1 Tax=Stegodyphus dumicola TaxID=202533 RepID=UPI0015A905BE|nr:zinc finger protein Xfin-like [Stegodyphus dumicola]
MNLRLPKNFSAEYDGYHITLFLLDVNIYLFSIAMEHTSDAMILNHEVAQPQGNMDPEYVSEHEDMPLDDQTIAIMDFGDLTSSQLDLPFVDSPNLSCSECNKTFAHQRSLTRHIKVQHSITRNICSICKKEFRRSDKLNNHMKIHAKPPKSTPSRSVKRVASLTTAPDSKRPRQERPPCLCTFVTKVFYPMKDTNKDLQVFLEFSRTEVAGKIEQAAAQHQVIKWYLNACVKMVRKVSETEEETCTPYFRSRCSTTLTREKCPICKQLLKGNKKVLDSLDKFLKKGSGWVLDSVQYLELKTAVYKPLAASSYIPLPKALASKMAVLNIQNEDHKCLVWSVLAALHPVEDHGEHAYRVSHYKPYEGEIHVDGLVFSHPHSPAGQVRENEQPVDQRVRLGKQ